jgi:hypothetical protein
LEEEKELSCSLVPWERDPLLFQEQGRILKGLQFGGIMEFIVLFVGSDRN